MIHSGKKQFFTPGLINALALTAIVMTSCCMADYKCKGDTLDFRFRLLSSGGNDLFFGPGRIYDNRQIRIYSLRGTDTIFHQCLPGPGTEPGKDSIMYVNLAADLPEKLYAKWNPTDSDSISLQLISVDASPCCPDYTDIGSVKLNNATGTIKGNWGVFELRK